MRPSILAPQAPAGEYARVCIRSLGGDLLFRGDVRLSSRSADVAREVCREHPCFRIGPFHTATLISGLSRILPDQSLIEAGILDGAELTLVIHTAPIALANTSRGLGAWNTESGQILWYMAWSEPDRSFAPSRDEVRLSPDGSRVLLRLHEQIRILDSLDGRLLQHWATSGTREPRLHDAVFQHDGESIVTVGPSITIRDTTTGCHIFLEFSDRGSSETRRSSLRVVPLCATSSRDGQYLIGTTNGALYWRNRNSLGRWLDIADQLVRSVCFSPDSRKAVLRGEEGTILLDVASDRVSSLMTSSEDTSLISPPIFSLDSAFLFLTGSGSSFENNLGAWSARTGERSWTYSAEDPSYTIASLAPLPDGRLVVCGMGSEKTTILRVCNTEGTVVAEAKHPSQRCATHLQAIAEEVAFFPSGELGRSSACTVHPSRDGTLFLLQDQDTLSIWSVDPLGFLRNMEELPPVTDNAERYCDNWHRYRIGRPDQAAIFQAR